MTLRACKPYGQEDAAPTCALTPSADGRAIDDKFPTLHNQFPDSVVILFKALMGISLTYEGHGNQPCNVHWIFRRSSTSIVDRLIPQSPYCMPSRGFPKTRKIHRCPIEDAPIYTALQSSFVKQVIRFHLFSHPSYQTPSKYMVLPQGYCLRNWQWLQRSLRTGRRSHITRQGSPSVAIGGVLARFRWQTQQFHEVSAASRRRGWFSEHQ